MKEIILLNVKDEIEATFVEDVLKDNGILSIRKYSGFSQYEKLYMGTTKQGIDIVIDDNDYEKAVDILSKASESYEGFAESESIDAQEEEDFNAYYQSVKKRRNKISNIIAGIILLGIAIIFSLIVIPLILTALSTL